MNKKARKIHHKDIIRIYLLYISMVPYKVDPHFLCLPLLLSNLNPIYAMYR